MPSPRLSPFRLLTAPALLPLLGVLALTLIGCGGPAKEAPQRSATDPIRVTATVGMVADIVRQVGGPHVQVTQICGPGVDPHLYKVTRDDARLLSDADMIFYSGLMLEGKMSDTLVKMARQRPVIAVTEAVDPALLLEPEALQGHYDPHVWMDVSAWSACVTAVQEALADEAPEHAQTFADNAAAYREQLDRLHRYAEQTIGSIPEQSRVLITSHDAFNYLGRAYGLDVQGVQGLSTESEAGLQRVNELVDLLVQRDVRAVFIESSVPRKSIDALIEGAQSRGHAVVVGGELYSDAMGPKGTYQGTYIGMLDHNVTTITQALGGKAPEGGMQGKLKR